MSNLPRTNSARPPHRTVLGKSLPREYPLLCHLLDTMAVADVLWDEVLGKQHKDAMRAGMLDENFLPIDARDVRRIALFSVGVHDIGKATPHWQRRTLGLPSVHPSLATGNGFLTMPEGEAVADFGKHHTNGAAFFALGHTGVVGNRVARMGLANCLQGHHGVFDQVSSGGLAKIEHGVHFPDWDVVQKDIEQVVADVGNVNTETFARLDEWTNESIMIVTGLIILADWIASRADFIGSQRNFDDPYEHFERARTSAREFINGWGLHKATWQDNLDWHSIFPLYTKPSDFQQSVIDGVSEQQVDGSGILMLSAPMGAGKTEIALYAAAHMGKKSGATGIWMNLPTQATSDAMFHRTVDVASNIYQGEDHSVALLHSNASISQAIESITQKNFTLAHSAVSDCEQVDTECEQGGGDGNLFISQFLIEKRLGGMSTMTVGTVDQMIRATTRLKHNQLRWLSVAGNVVILDEIHDFDPYTFHLIKKHISWCGALGVPVIAISATLSGSSQRELVEAYWAGRDHDVSRKTMKQWVNDAIPMEGIGSPAWFFAPLDPAPIARNNDIPAESYPKYRTRIDRTYSFIDRTRDIVRQTMDDGGQTLVVCNTVDQAVETYNDLSQRHETLLLHSRMTQEQKSEVIAQILSRSGKPRDDEPRLPYVLVSTQIVQQSMDIDFDVLVSSFAPLDETLQRIGRVHRHHQGDRRAKEFRESPKVHILVPPTLIRLMDGLISPDEDFLPGVIPYSHWEMMSTYKLLHHIRQGRAEFKWDAKGDIKTTYQDYAVLFNSAWKGTLDDDWLTFAFENYKGSVLHLEGVANGDAVSIPMPMRGNLMGLTSNLTHRDHDAPTTRLIDDTVTMLPVWTRNDDFFLDPECSLPLPCDNSIESLRNIGLRTIGVSQKFAENIVFLDSDKPNLQSIPPYIKAFYPVNMGNDSLMLNSTLGLVRRKASFSTWL